ncbi:hypothetical protein Fmac_010354 [Flemingia macrophylla]|uniref:C2 domain-containing protein n=1 Tax=Flemingia macrophylla TaxID=520843 RepID=A0ABD1MJB9_9FABA
MSITSRTLEITVISGENISVTEDAYVVVRAESLKSCTTRTAKDDGSSFLSWNHKLLLHVPNHARSVTFEVHCNKLKAFRPFGVARIALSDFQVSENQLQVFSYGLRSWEGKRNGVIHFTVRVAAPPPDECRKYIVEPVARRACGERFERINATDKKFNEIVVGVPLWKNYPSVI